MRIDDSLVNFDKISDYTPFLSTGTNLTDLFVKSVVLPFKSKENIQSNHYYTHLKQKSFARCIILLIPFLGNLIFGVVDFGRKKDKEFSLSMIATNKKPTAQNFTPNELKDRDIALALVKKNGVELEKLSNEFRNDEEFVIAACKQNPKALDFASERIRELKNKALQIIEQSEKPRAADLNPLALKFKPVALALVKKNGIELKHISHEFQDDEEIVDEAVSENILAMEFVSKRIWNREDYEACRNLYERGKGRVC